MPLIAFSQGLSPAERYPLLPDGTIAGIGIDDVNSWAANRSADRQSIRYLLIDKSDLQKENSILRGKNEDHVKKEKFLESERDTANAMAASFQMQLMNCVNKEPVLKAWATVGKVGTVVVCVAVVTVAVVVISNELKQW